MLSAIGPVRSLLLAIFVLMAGSGFMSTLVSLRLSASGADDLTIGLVGTAYFGGLTIGAANAGRVVRRVGHIRAFAAFVALLSASVLSYAIYESTPFWAALRVIDGLCAAGVYVCLESWLSDRAEPHTRGSILAAYMIALYAGQAVAQFLLNLGAPGAATPFMAASVLISLAILPIVLTRSPSPAITDQPAVPMRALYAISPLAMVGTAITGLMLGAFYGLGAVYSRRLGLDIGSTAVFMSTVIAGGVALQWPLGWLSDRFDRRLVIVAVFAGAALVCAGLAAAAAPGAALLVMGALFGGLSFALYPLCVAHANDHVSADQRVGASGGLVMVYSAGSIAGPTAGGAAMTLLGAPGLFAFAAAAAAAAVAFAVWRMTARAPVPAELQQSFQTLPRTTPVSAALDPLAPDEPEPASPPVR